MNKIFLKKIIIIILIDKFYKNVPNYEFKSINKSKPLINVL